MSQACISYGSLKDASSEASQVAKKLDKYADNLDSQIYKKLNNYSGSYTTNIAQAKSNVNSKISDLRHRAQSYRTYSQDLSDLKDRCVDTDKAVKTNVSKLTAEFKSSNGIKDSKIQNTINYFLTSIENKTSVGRWLGNKRDEFGAAKDYIKQSLEDWWDYEGGAEAVKGIAIGVLEGVIAVCAIVGALLSGGALLVVIAGFVAGAIALVNAGVNIYNEVAAYNTTRNGDPATGRRRSDINTAQDSLRSSFWYGDDGEQYKYDSKLYAIAAGIDVVNFVCETITFVDGLKGLVKNTYKWATGSMADIEHLRIRDILTKENFAAFKSKMGSSLSEIDHAVRTRNMDKISKFMFDFGDDFLNNLKKGYTFEIFAEDKKVGDFIKHGANLVKNYSSIAKPLVSDGINVSNVAGMIKTLALENINIADVVTYKGGNRGVFSYDIDSIKLTDVTGTIEDTLNLPIDIATILGKMSGNSSVSIRIPEINMPDLSGINAFNRQMVRI